MKRQLLTLLTLCALFIGCSKKDSSNPETQPEGLKKFEISNITASKESPVIGQRTIFNAILTDSTGNINYEWKIFFNGQQFGKTLFGPEYKSVKNYSSELGTYTITLSISRGASEKHTFEKKYTTVAGDFQFGNWGDSEPLISVSESDNGGTENQTLIGIPSITPNNQGLATITFDRNSGNYIYYFKDKKLYAGAFVRNFRYYGATTDLSTAYLTYETNKSNMGKHLGVTMTEVKTWNLVSSQIAYWDSTIALRSEAIGKNYLSISASGESSKGKGIVKINKLTSEYISHQYTIVSNN